MLLPDMVTTNVEEVMEEEDPHGKKEGKKSKVNHQIKLNCSICFICQRSTFLFNDIEILKHATVFGSGDKKQQL